MTWRGRLDAIQVGATVRFTRRALRAIFVVEPIRVSPEGIVTAIREEDGMRFAEVDRGEPNIPDLVNTLNLRMANERVGERDR